MYKFNYKDFEIHYIEQLDKHRLTLNFEAIATRKEALSNNDEEYILEFLDLNDQILDYEQSEYFGHIIHYFKLEYDFDSSEIYYGNVDRIDENKYSFKYYFFY